MFFVFVVECIVFFLNGKDLINLGKICKFWNEIFCKNIVWKIFIERWFGWQVIFEVKNIVIDYKGFYFKLVIGKKLVIFFDIVWLNGYYLQKVKDRESGYGEVF